MGSAATPWLLGLDFSSAPSGRKPLTLAWGHRVGSVVRLERVDELPTHAALSALLAPDAPGPLSSGFVMGCDFPFGLPRVFVEALATHGPGLLPRWLGGLEPVPGVALDQAHALSETERLIRALHAHCEDRAGFQRLVDGWGDTWLADRPPGPRLAHRTADLAIPDMVSTSPLQTRYVPVGKMYFEGLMRLVAADLTLPGQREGRPHAVALEAYPGWLAREVLGRRSYKSDAVATDDRLIARKDLVAALEQGRTRLGLRLKLSAAQHDALVADPKGDRLDAVLCLVQAAWGQQRAEAGDARYGIPAGIDPVEGWILTG
ncbi:DUF429 domain-containing protein [uncultured Aquabacterium sp.]|jgi:hypothetical protein|uniref:DUF429 domain-containing protein n=1 Tax=uncultured Aquabacterium sp. TaxID=158753 RepID=UPI002602A8C2|nr:DUF429 domain-containing protein [uncultured Aquabacterium sp.]